MNTFNDYGLGYIAFGTESKIEDCPFDKNKETSRYKEWVRGYNEHKNEQEKYKDFPKVNILLDEDNSFISNF